MTIKLKKPYRDLEEMVSAGAGVEKNTRGVSLKQMTKKGPDRGLQHAKHPDGTRQGEGHLQVGIWEKKQFFSHSAVKTGCL